MNCIKHFAPIQYIDIKVGVDQKNRALCQMCVSKAKQLEPGVITLKYGEDLMNQVYQQRLDEYTKMQTYYEGIQQEIQVLVDATKSKIFDILSELYQKSVFIYESYFEGWQLAEQLSKDINFNQNPVEIKPLLYDDPSLLKNHNKLTEILNILKPKLEKMEVEAEVSKYQITRPLTYSKDNIRISGHREQVNEVAFSNDCTMAASGSHDTFVNLWCLKTQSKLKQYKGHKGVVLCVAFSKCSTLLASGEHYNTPNAINQILIWDIANLKKNTPLYKLNGHTSAIYHLKFAKNFLLSSSIDGSIRLWKQDNQIACYQMKTGVLGVSLSNDQQLIAGNSELFNCIWHVGKGKIISQWLNHQKDGQGGMCFSNHSKLLFQSSWNGGKLMAWNCYTEKPKLIRKTKFNYAFDCSVSSDSTTLATADTTYNDNQGFIHLIDISTWKHTQDLTVNGGYAEEGCGSYNYANFSSDDQYLGTGSGDGSIRIFKRKQDNEDNVGQEVVGDGDNDSYGYNSD